MLRWGGLKGGSLEPSGMFLVNVPKKTGERCPPPLAGLFVFINYTVNYKNSAVERAMGRLGEAIQTISTYVSATMLFAASGMFAHHAIGNLERDESVCASSTTHSPGDLITLIDVASICEISHQVR